jgi:hypothetical protein
MTMFCIFLTFTCFEMGSPLRREGGLTDTGHSPSTGGLKGKVKFSLCLTN